MAWMTQAISVRELDATAHFALQNVRAFSVSAGRVPLIER
jgi:hypothetical protein